MSDSVRLRPSHERSAAELGSVVGSHDLRVAPEDRGLLKHACDVLAREAKINCDVDALVANVVRYGHDRPDRAVTFAGIRT